MDRSQRLRARARAVFWVCVGLGSAVAHADVVTTTDGARLTGTINKITPKIVELKTDYAGTLTVDMTKVTSVTSDAPLTTQFKDSSTVTGVTTIDQESIKVTSDTVASSSPVGQLQASWLPSAEPPKESLFDPRHWVYNAGADIAGDRGRAGVRSHRGESVLAHAGWRCDRGGSRCCGHGCACAAPSQRRGSRRSGA